jgi:phosphopentomutase
MKRAIVLVIDALGVGALPDAPQFGDPPGANTLGNVAKANGGLTLPYLGRLGLGNILEVAGVPSCPKPQAAWGRMAEASHGKDTTTGHWELAGLILDRPFNVYPSGFPDNLISEFVARTGCGGVLGNIPASGTAIIEEFHQEHLRTGRPILYTSADSVFQIAVETSRVPLAMLSAWCETARALLDERAEEHNVSRVIARPYLATAEGLRRDNANRHDYAVLPTGPTLFDHLHVDGYRTLSIGKIVDIFLGRGVTHAVRSATNKDGLELTLQALRGTLDLTSCRQLPNSDAFEGATTKGEFVFINLVDTDSLYGHRNDPIGYGLALEEIDAYIPDFLAALGPDDLFIITGDHGCDPTVPGTDHTREYVPLLVHGGGSAPCDLGTFPSFTEVARRVETWLGCFC